MRVVQLLTSHFRWVLGLLLMSVAFFLVWHFTTGNSSPETTSSTTTKNKRSPQQPPVQSVAVIQQDVPYFLSALGTVVPKNSVTIQSLVTGQLQALHFIEGQFVNQGQLLAEIDPRPFEIQLLQAQGTLLSANAALANAKRDLVRYQSLIKTNLVTQQQRDTQQSLTTQLEGQVKTAQAAVNNAQLQLTHSKISAPISGKVGLKQIDVGNIINASNSNGIVVITQTQPITVLFTLPETYIALIRQAQKNSQPIDIEAWDRTNQQLLSTGTLLSIDNQIDVQTGTIKLKAQFTNQDDQLFPNQFVNVRLKAMTLHNVITVPTSSIQLGNQGHFVWLINDGRVSKRAVETGLQSEQNTVITKGLNLGEEIVIDGVDYLTEGMQVKVIKPKEITPNSSPLVLENTPHESR